MMKIFNSLKNLFAHLKNLFLNLNKRKDEAKRLFEEAVEKMGVETDSPVYKLMKDYAEREIPNIVDARSAKKLAKRAKNYAIRQLSKRKPEPTTTDQEDRGRKKLVKLYVGVVVLFLLFLITSLLIIRPSKQIQPSSTSLWSSEKLLQYLVQNDGEAKVVAKGRNMVGRISLSDGKEIYMYLPESIFTGCTGKAEKMRDGTGRYQLHWYCPPLPK